MKLNRALWVMILAGLAGLSATTAKAQGDPFINQAGDPPWNNEPLSIITGNFSILSPSGTSPVTLPNGSPCVLMQGGLSEPTLECYFKNEIVDSLGNGLAVTDLIFDLPNISEDSVSCSVSIGEDPSDFGTCTPAVDESDSDSTTVTFSDGSIPYDTAFFLELGGFPADFTTSVIAVTPEPGTLPMFGMGLIALLGLTRKRIFQRVE